MQGINYFDVAPFYGSGEAEQKMGSRWLPIGTGFFLPAKPWSVRRKGAREELEQSLRHLRTDHFDLYQFHAVSDLEEVDEIFAPGGALEAFLQAQEAGQNPVYRILRPFRRGGACHARPLSF